MKALLLITTIIAALSFSGVSGGAEQARIGMNERREKIVLPTSAPDKSRFVTVDRIFIEDEEMGLGTLIFYDDRRTKLRVDYIEFYDATGNLLLMSWIDRLGICQVAIDRGLLDEENPHIERIMVSIAAGTEL